MIVVCVFAVFAVVISLVFVVVVVETLVVIVVPLDDEALKENDVVVLMNACLELLC